MTMIIYSSYSWLSRDKHVQHSYGYTILRTCTFSFSRVVHMSVLYFTCLHRCTFLQSRCPVRKYESQELIAIIPSWPLPWRQIRPCPLVVIVALHQLHRLLWLAEPLAVRVRVSICGLSGLIRAGKETAERHVYRRAARSAKGCKEYRQSGWWEG